MLTFNVAVLDLEEVIPWYMEWQIKRGATIVIGKLLGGGTGIARKKSTFGSSATLEFQLDISSDKIQFGKKKAKKVYVKIRYD